MGDELCPLHLQFETLGSLMNLSLASRSSMGPRIIGFEGK